MYIFLYASNRLMDASKVYSYVHRFTCIFRCYCCWCCCFYLDINLRAFAEWDGKCVFSRRTQFSRFRWTFFYISNELTFLSLPFSTLSLFHSYFIYVTVFDDHVLQHFSFKVIGQLTYLSLKLIDHLVIGIPMCIFAKLRCNAHFFCLISIRK